jgi:hypothetical protein
MTELSGIFHITWNMHVCGKAAQVEDRMKISCPNRASFSFVGK